MCGIIGIIGKNIKNELISGLEKMRYRGYDSCGITFNKDGLCTIKTLEEPSMLTTQNTDFDTGIGHTRWATHGKVNIINAHPIASFDEKVYIVHNGIIENSKYIKNTYLKNIQFKTETDTEVLVNLIALFMREINIIDSIEKASKIAIGSYSFLIMNKNETEEIYYCSNNMPLVLTIFNNNKYIASDILALPKSAKKYKFLFAHSVGKLSNLTSKELIDQSIGNVYDDNIGIFEHNMLKEIFEIPNIINKISKNSLFEPFIILIKKAKKICFIGSGSSYNACLVGSYFIQNKEQQKMISTTIASEFSAYPDLSCDLYFLVSQSGETADILESLKYLKDKTTIGICNCKNSTLIRNTDYFIDMCAGPEIAVAATKSYVSTIFIFYSLSNFYSKENTISIIQSINNVLSKADIFFKLSKKFTNTNLIFLLGRNYEYYINLENALKIKEITYTSTDCYFTGELKHGPLALCSKNVKVFVLNTIEAMSIKTKMNVEEILAREAECFVISSNSLYSKEDFYCLSLNNDLCIFEIVIMFQLFSYYLSLNKGINPDFPRNLAKSVTVI